MLLYYSISFVRRIMLIQNGATSKLLLRQFAEVSRNWSFRASFGVRIIHRVQCFKNILVSVPWRSSRGFLLGAALGLQKGGSCHVIVQQCQTEYSPTQIRQRGLLKIVAQVLNEIYSSLKVLFRTLQMFVMVLPMVLSFPLAMSSKTLKKHWFKTLIGVIQFCGPVYVKLGQWASTRRDIFPSDVCFYLSKLQQNVETHPWKFTEQLLNETFGQVVMSAAFTNINQIPIGSGCCAQVYLGWLDVSAISLDSRQRLKRIIKKRVEAGVKSGISIPVAIKVLHPEISEKFSRDLLVLNSVVNFLSKLVPSLEWLSIKESIHEFGDLMNKQTNLTNEADSLLRFNKDFGDNSGIIFPLPIREFCKADVIVETFETGTPLSQITNNLESVPMLTRKSLAEIGVEMLMKMIFRNNFVHGDLHPGNLLVRGMDSKSGFGENGLQLVVLDPGIVATLSKKDLSNFRSVFTAIVRRDGRKVGQLFLDQSQNRCMEPEKFIQQMDSIVSDAMSQELSLSKLDVGNLLSRVFNVLRCHEVKLDPNFTSVILAIMVLEGLGRSLDPDIDLLLKATPFLIHM